MERTFSRCFASVVLIFCLAGPVVADDGREPDDASFYFFSKWFNNEIGDDFSKMLTFELQDLSSFDTLVATQALDGLSLSFFDRTDNTPTSLLASHESASNPLVDLDFAPDPGRHAPSPTGDIVDGRAAYSMILSAVPVPEPAPWLLLLAGAAMLGMIVYRRQL